MKKCTNNREFFKREYILFGKSTIQIAEEFGFSITSIWRRLKKFGFNRNISEANKGKNNGMWKGDNVGIGALHEWIIKNKPKLQFCECCNKKIPYDLANISGEYKRDINDFRWLCRSCHMKEDYKLGIRKPKGFKN